jgi:hypothetical protein
LLRFRLGFAIAVAASSFMGAGCFTDPVNMAPTVRIDTPTTTENGMTVAADPFFRGVQLTYTATASDTDGDGVHLEWQLQLHADQGCPPGFDRPENQPTQNWVAEPSLLVLPEDNDSKFCVWVRAIDSHGAAAVDARTGVPQDHPPVAHVVLVSPTGAGPFAPSATTPFELSAASSTDDDARDVPDLTFAWAMQTSLCSSAGLIPCADHPSDDRFICFLADNPGDCQIEVTVTDPASESSTTDITLMIQRGPPPVAAIDLVSPTGLGPYKLDHEMRVSAAHSTVGDNAHYVWTLEHPDGTKDTPGACDNDTTDVTKCFVPNASGDYHVSLTVSDDSGMSTTSLPVTVAPDQPPCIMDTTPPLSVTETDVSSPFAVNIVDDDRDPFPGVADINWFLSVNGADFTLEVPNWPTFTSFNKAAFSPTDDVRVRVEVYDRNTTRSVTELSNCITDRCSLPSVFDATCLQRVTWKVLLQ